MFRAVLSDQQWANLLDEPYPALPLCCVSMGYLRTQISKVYAYGFDTETSASFMKAHHAVCKQHDMSFSVELAMLVEQCEEYIRISSHEINALYAEYYMG